MTRLRSLEGERDVAALHALYRRSSVAELGAQLRDGGHAHGARVVIAEHDDEVVGGLGWVEAPPWCYGSPLIARAPEVAAALLDELCARARACGAERMRVSVFPDEAGKRAALEAAGFAPQFDFVTVVRAGGGATAPWSRAWPRIAWEALDAARFVEVLDATFVDVPNSPPLAADEMRRLLDRPLTCRASTAAYGDYDAFVHVEHDTDDDGPHAVIATIGVRAAHRGHGVAGAVLDDALSRLEEPECRALIASTNTASLALHAARGFVERSRRSVFERATAR